MAHERGLLRKGELVEFKVLGKGTVEVNGNHKSLADAISTGVVRDIEDILNVLGKDGWEGVTLEPPFVFRRG